MSKRASGIDVLILSMEAYPSSTRARKTAHALAQLGRSVEFLGMSRAGRTGRWAEPGVSTQDGVTARLVDMRAPATEPTRRNQLRNAALTYLPAMFRMAIRIFRSPADVVIVSGTPLLLLGLLHRQLHHSSLVLDVAERPGAVAAQGSATALFSKVESSVIRLARSSTDLVTAAVQPDVEFLRRIGFRRVELLRNAPTLAWRADYIEPPEGLLRFVSIGSVFEGRGYEILIRAAAEASKLAEFTIDVFGMGRDEYLTALRSLTTEVGADGVVTWRGPLDPTQVSAAYLEGHVGLVLYESDDPGNDGLSNKILECVSTGRPVLAGDLPENRQFVDEFSTGWVTQMQIAPLSNSLVSVSKALPDLSTLAMSCRNLGDEWLNWDSEFSRSFRSLLVEREDERSR